MTTFWGLFFGTVIGIVAGAFLQYGAQLLLIRSQRQNLLDAMKRELEYDIPVIEGLIQEVGRFRATIGAQTLGTYAGYFKLTNVFFVLGNRALAEGLLYKAMAQDKLVELAKAATFFNAGSENWVWSQVQLHMQGQGGGQTAAITFANFLDNQLTEHRDNLRDIARTIARTRVRFWQR